MAPSSRCKGLKTGRRSACYSVFRIPPETICRGHSLANIDLGQRHDGIRICVPERRRFGNRTDDRLRGTSSGASQLAQGGSVNPPKSSERCSLPPIVWYEHEGGCDGFERQKDCNSCYQWL